ncbi:hypothetical protein PtB15_10B138 [Puccinia triticina]|nr:hypothetical protein PtB15_10B138 [Puccinia triticina]
MWGSPEGWNSTAEVLNVIRDVVTRNGPEGKGNWKDYILEEAKACVASDGPKRHEPKEGVTWFNASEVKPAFFNAEARLSRDQHLAAKGMPFLFKLIMSKVSQNDPNGFEEEDTNDREWFSCREESSFGQ